MVKRETIVKEQINEHFYSENGTKIISQTTKKKV